MTRGLDNRLGPVALVLAAGKGTRIQSVVPDRPKPLIEVNGQTVIERHLRRLAAAGIVDVWINLHYRGEQIERLIGDGRRYGVNVRYSREPVLLGTAGAAKKLESVLSRGTFFVIYGDNLVELELTDMLRRHRQRGASVTIAVFDRDCVPNTGLAGGRVVLNGDGAIDQFVEGAASDSPYVNAGIYAVEPSVLDLIPPDVFYDFGHQVFPDLIARGARVDAYSIDGYCLAIDTPEALGRAEALIREVENDREVATR